MIPPVPGVDASTNVRFETNYAVRAETLGVDENLELSLTLTPDGHIRHAGNTHQARPDVPASEEGHVDQGHLVRREPDEHHAARGRDRLEHLGRFRDLGQGMCLGESLLHHLASIEDVRARFEDHLDR